MSFLQLLFKIFATIGFKKYILRILWLLTIWADSAIFLF